MMGRITGSDSMETLYKVKLSQRNATNPQTRRIILHTFAGGGPDELAIKQGQKVHILYRESDWAYVIADDKREGYVPFSFCASMGTPPAYRAPVVDIKGQVVPNGHGPESDKIARDESFTSDFVSPSFVSSSWSDYTTFSDQSTLLEANNQTGDTAKVLENGRDRMSTPYQNIPQFHEIFHYLNEQAGKTVDAKETNEEIDTYAPIIKPPPEYEDSDSPNLTDADKSVASSLKREHHTHTAITDTHVDACIPISDVNTPDCSKSVMDSPQSRKVVQFDPEAPQVIPEATPFVKQPHGRYIVLYDFAAMDENDVATEAVEIVMVLNKDDPDWFWVQKANNIEGFVPSSFLFKLDLIETTGDLNVHKPVFPVVVDSAETVSGIHNQMINENVHSENISMTKCLMDNIQDRGGAEQHTNIQRQYQSDNSTDKQFRIKQHSTDTMTIKQESDTKHNQYSKCLKTKPNNNLNQMHTSSVTNNHNLNTQHADQRTSTTYHQQHSRRARSPTLNVRKNSTHFQQERPKSTPPFNTNTEDENICENSYIYTGDTSDIKHSIVDKPINVSKIIETRHSKTIIKETSSSTSYDTTRTEADTNNKHVTNQSTTNNRQCFYPKDHNTIPSKTQETGAGNPKHILRHPIQNTNQTKHAESQPNTHSASMSQRSKQAECSSSKINQNRELTWQNLAKVVKVQSQNGTETSRSSNAQTRHSSYQEKVTNTFPKNGKSESHAFRNSLCNIQSSESIKQLYTNNQQGLANGKVTIIHNNLHRSDQPNETSGKPHPKHISSYPNKEMAHGVQNSTYRKEHPQEHGPVSGTGQTEHTPTTAISTPVLPAYSTMDTNTSHGNESSKSMVACKSDEHNSLATRSLINGTTRSKVQNNSDSNKQERNFSSNKQVTSTNHNNKATTNQEYPTVGQQPVDGNNGNKQSKQDSHQDSKSNSIQYGASHFQNFEEFVSEFDYKAQTEQEMSMHKCETIYINPSDQSNGYWYWAYSPKQKRYGYIPKAYVKLPVITMI